jgi:hypothetical protein
MGIFNTLCRYSPISELMSLLGSTARWETISFQYWKQKWKLPSCQDAISFMTESDRFGVGVVMVV